MDKIREKLNLTVGQSQELLFGDLDDFEVVKDKIIENSRWSIRHLLIVKRTSDGKFFQDGYSVGATEMQEERPWEYDKPNFLEVFPVEKTIIVYE